MTSDGPADLAVPAESYVGAIQFRVVGRAEELVSPPGVLFMPPASPSPTVLSRNPPSSPAEIVCFGFAAGATALCFAHRAELEREAAPLKLRPYPSAHTLPESCPLLLVEPRLPL